MTRLLVRSPATVANLGPGFDCLALALGLENEVEVDRDGPPEVVVEGEGAGELPGDRANLVVRAAAYAARHVGARLPPFALRCRNRIPLEQGLGSSAAAVVAGLLIGDRLVDGGLGPDRLLELAADLEGHPDNVAACLRGGLVVAYRSASGWCAERVEPSPDLRPALLVPDADRVPTPEARRALPAEVSFADAAFTLSRTALAMVALTTRTDLLPVALEDRLHQPYRLPLAPQARAVFEGLRSKGVPVCLCGSGPSLLAFEGGDRPVPDPGPGWRVLRPGVSRTGAMLEPGGANAPPRNGRSRR